MIAALIKFWYVPAIAALLALLGFEQYRIQSKDAKIQHYADVMKITTERINGAAATFKAEQEAQARRIETAQNQASQETASEYSSKLHAALALAAQRVRDGKAVGGGTSGTGKVGGASDPTSPASGNGGMSVVDENDLLICTTNTVKAQGWLAWWKKIAAIPR